MTERERERERNTEEERSNRRTERRIKDYIGSVYRISLGEVRGTILLECPYDAENSRKHEEIA